MTTDTHRLQRAYRMIEVLDEEREAGGVLVRAVAYVEDLEEDNAILGLPALYATQTGDERTRWHVDDLASAESVVRQARYAFECACGQAELDYIESGQARRDAAAERAGV